MTAAELAQWFEREGGLIARWQPGGLFGRELVIPPGIAALTQGTDETWLTAGSDLDGPALLLRARELPVSIVVDGLRDPAGFEGTFSLTLSVIPPPGRTPALLLRDHALGSAPRYGAAELAQRLEPHLRDRLQTLLAGHSWDGEGGVMEYFRSSRHAIELFEAPLFELGLTLGGVTGFGVDSETLEERRQREAELRRETERVRDRLEFLDLWKREEIGQALAREEVEKLAGHLRRQGLLREIENAQQVALERLRAQEQEVRSRGQLRRMLERERIAVQADIDGERLEREIERARRLQEVLERHGLLPVVGQLGDLPDHARLLELLVEKEMTPEQIEARAGPRHQERLEQRFAELAERLRGELFGAAPATDALPSASEIWLAAGLALYRIGAASALGGGLPTPVLPSEDIGFLRSVSATHDAQGALLLVGAQGGVATYRPADAFWKFYRYRPAADGRGGANAVALCGDHLVASHSELGLHSWPVAGTAGSQPVLPELIRPGVATRGVHVFSPGGVVFSHGSEVLMVEGIGSQPTATSLGVLPDSITALCVAGARVAAGTRDGRLFLLTGARWRELPFRTSGPVFGLSMPGAGMRAAEVAGVSPATDRSGEGEIGFVVGARQTAVHVLDPEGQLLVEYRWRAPIRWVAAARQALYAVDRFGLELLVWRWDRQSAPARRVRVPDQIHCLEIAGQDGALA